MAMVRFDNRCFEVEYEGDHINVDNLSGWQCGECGEVIFDQESAERYRAAGDRLVIAKRK
jgi:HTH-type transcriptional regulator/antitoxin MqsA